MKTGSILIYLRLFLMLGSFPLGDIGGLIVSHLCPEDLLTCATVSKDFLFLVRSDVAWARHKTRLLFWCPELAAVFDAHRRNPRRKRQKTGGLTWKIFAHYLLPPLPIVLERTKQLRPLLVRAALSLCFRTMKHSRIVLEKPSDNRLILMARVYFKGNGPAQAIFFMYHGNTRLHMLFYASVSRGIHTVEDTFRALVRDEHPNIYMEPHVLEYIGGDDGNIEYPRVV